MIDLSCDQGSECQGVVATVAIIPMIVLLVRTKPASVAPTECSCASDFETEVASTAAPKTGTAEGLSPVFPWRGVQISECSSDRVVGGTVVPTAS